MTWNPHNQLQLCCGLADGTIAIWDLDPTFSHPPTPQNPLKKSTSISVPMHSTVLECSADKDISDDVARIGPRSGIRTDDLPGRSSNLEACKDYKFKLPKPSAWLADHNTDFSLAPRSALKSVSFCPYNPHLLMTSGYESAIKVRHWSLLSMTVHYSNLQGPTATQSISYEHFLKYTSSYFDCHFYTIS